MFYTLYSESEQLDTTTALQTGNGGYNLVCSLYHFLVIVLSPTDDSNNQLLSPVDDLLTITK